jgi:hypothetical protein
VLFFSEHRDSRFLSLSNSKIGLELWSSLLATIAIRHNTERTPFAVDIRLYYGYFYVLSCLKSLLLISPPLGTSAYPEGLHPAEAL